MSVIYIHLLKGAKTFALNEVFPKPENMVLLSTFTKWYQGLDKKQDASLSSTATILQGMSANPSLVGQANQDADATTDTPKQAATSQQSSGYSSSEEQEDGLDLSGHGGSTNSDSGSSYSPRF